MYQLSALQGENQLASSDLSQRMRGKIQNFMTQTPSMHVNHGEYLQQRNFQQSPPILQSLIGNQIGLRGGGFISDISHATMAIRNSPQSNQHSSNSISTTYSLINENNQNGRDTGALQVQNDFLLGMDESARYAKDTGEEEEEDDDVSNESIAERKILKIDRRLSNNRQQIDKTQKRRLQNRKSALKCRLRKSHLIATLQKEVAFIKSEKQIILKEVLQLRDRVKEEQLANSALLVELTKLQADTKGQLNQLSPSPAQSQAQSKMTLGNLHSQQAFPLVIHQNHIGLSQLPVHQMNQVLSSSNPSQAPNSTFIIDQPNMNFNQDNIINISPSTLQQNIMIAHPQQHYVQTMNQIQQNSASGVSTHHQGTPIQLKSNTIITTAPIIGVQQGATQGFYQSHTQPTQAHVTVTLTQQQANSAHLQQPQQVYHQHSSGAAGLNTLQPAAISSIQQQHLPAHHQVLGLQQQQYVTYIPQQIQTANEPQAIGNIQQPQQYGQNTSIITQANRMTGQVGGGGFNLQNQASMAYGASLGQGNFIPATQLFVQQQTGNNYGK